MKNYVWKIISPKVEKKGKNWLADLLAKNRGLITKKQLDKFLNPTFEQILEVKLTDVPKAVARIKEAIGKKEKTVVYSDYDADGLCATGVMWETLYDLGADVMPYVPHRVKEGYGLAKPAISQLAKDGIKLIITVDHGVTAFEQVEHAKSLGVDVIITDHHVLPSIVPKPFALVHSTALCGAGVSWRLCWEIVKKIKPAYKDKLLDKLDLAALATIADLVPLNGGSRAIVKLGLEKLSKNPRPGIKALIKSSGVTGNIGTYEIGHVIAPRINAMGRIEHGLDSLRLLCAKSQVQADKLAQLLTTTNTRRQDLTTKAISSALDMITEETLIGVVSHTDWHEGVIGLVASRLVETYHRPIIAISRGETFSKGSARSIPGFNIVEAIRASSEYLVDAGGHPMAAGFTIETKQIELFKAKITRYAQSKITEDLLVPLLVAECELTPQDINMETVNTLDKFEPYGIGNPRPLFVTKNILVEDVRCVGAQNQHLKLQLEGISAIGFNFGQMRAKIRPGYLVDVMYDLCEDTFNGRGQVQMKLKDIVVPHGQQN